VRGFLREIEAKCKSLKGCDPAQPKKRPKFKEEGFRTYLRGSCRNRFLLAHSLKDGKADRDDPEERNGFLRLAMDLGDMRTT